MHPLLQKICDRLDYYEIRAQKDEDGKLTPREERQLIFEIKLELQFIPEVAKNQVLTCWAQAVTNIIWEIHFLTDRAKMQLSDIIDSNVSHVEYGPKLTLQQAYKKVAQRTGLLPDQVQLAVEGIMNLHTEQMAIHYFIQQYRVVTKFEEAKTTSDDKATKKASKKGKGSMKKAKAASQGKPKKKAPANGKVASVNNSEKRKRLGENITKSKRPKK